MIRQHLAFSSRQYQRTILLLLMLGLIGATSFFTHRQSSAAVTLVTFTGTYTDDPGAMSIQWETGSEIGTAGFLLRRSDGGQAEVDIDVEYNDETVSFVNSLGGDLGFIYEVADINVVSGTFYKYTLYEREINNSEPIKVGEFEIRATVGSSSIEVGSTNTPQPTLTHTPTATASVTETGATPSSEASPTADGFQATSTPAGTTDTEVTLTPEATNESGSDITATPDQSQAATATLQPTATATPLPSPTTEQISEVEESAEQETQSAESSPESEEILNESEQTAQNGDNNGVASDLGAVAEAAESEQYPDPTTDGEPETDPDPEAQEGYVPPVASEIGEEESDGLAVKPIAGDVELPTDEVDTTGTLVEADTTNNNRLILWGSFIASLLMFVTGVVGAIFMFRQKQG